jgi:ABC-type branched-subunit amino acid transport system substrate-binding protein
MDRRTFLHGLAAAAAASAAGVRAASPLNVAVMLPMSGPAGLFGPSAKACAELAVQTINARGGVLGRTINPLFGDAGLPPAEAS